MSVLHRLNLPLLLMLNVPGLTETAVDVGYLIYGPLMKSAVVAFLSRNTISMQVPEMYCDH